MEARKGQYFQMCSHTGRCPPHHIFMFSRPNSVLSEATTCVCKDWLVFFFIQSGLCQQHHTEQIIIILPMVAWSAVPAPLEMVVTPDTPTNTCSEELLQGIHRKWDPPRSFQKLDSTCAHFRFIWQWKSVKREELEPIIFMLRPSNRINSQIRSSSRFFQLYIFHHLNFPRLCIINEWCGLLMKWDQRGESQLDPHPLPAAASPPAFQLLLNHRLVKKPEQSSNSSAHTLHPEHEKHRKSKHKILVSQFAI